MAMKPLALGEVQLPPQYNHLLCNVLQETINSAFTQNIPEIIENIFQRCERSTKEGNKIK
jgi:hypothetical protein